MRSLVVIAALVACRTPPPSPAHPPPIATITVDAATPDAAPPDAADESLVRQLSLDRANAVRRELLERYKLPAGQLVAKGYGSTQPAVPAEPNSAANRRIEITVFSKQ